MADLGVEMTDKRVDEIKERLLSAYKEAASDLQKKAEEHTKRFEEKDERKRADMDSGKLSEEDYQKWLKGQVFIGKQWQSKVDQMARMLTNAEKVAVQIVRDGQMATFADNANYTEYCIDKDTGFGVNFSLYDESTVMLLLQDQPELMPRRVVDDEKCEAWNQKVIANCITQGILQGESIPQIAKRMARDTASTDMKAMVRYARTAMTGAQNSGRIYAMEKSIEQGVEVKKVWIATLDERTRDAHLDLDGQIQDVNEPFDSELGPIMYPGDPGADEANVWNCRCTLGYEYPDSPSKGQRYDQMFGEDIDDMSFDEWFEWRKGQIKGRFNDADSKVGESVYNASKRFNDEISQQEKKIKELQDEFSETFTKSLIAFGTDDYDVLQKRLDEIESESVKAYSELDRIKAEYERYLKQEGGSEIKKVFGEIKGEHGILEDLQKINLTEQGVVTQNNCGYCSLAYDARRRGIDCSAAELFGSQDQQMENWWKDFSFTRATSYYSADAVKEITDTVEQWGVGARGIVVVDYSPTFGHAFVFEVDKNGKCIFSDGQTGAMGVLNNFDNVVPGSIRYGRTDDKELTNAALLFLRKGR